MTGQILFSILVVVHLAFILRVIGRLPEASEAFISRLAQVLPEFQGKQADVKSSLFCLSILVFIVVMTLVVFRQ